MEQEQEKFTFFWGGIFSQWHPSSFQIDGVTYNTAEQYMMAEKARMFGDKLSEQKIMMMPDPKAQKALGRKVVGFVAEKWNASARDIVYKGNVAKFTQNPSLLKNLLDTRGTVLVEASPYDTIWGIGLAESDPRAKLRAQWKGLNWLGEVLTKVRDDYERGDLSV